MNDYIGTLKNIMYLSEDHIPERNWENSYNLMHGKKRTKFIVSDSFLFLDEYKNVKL